MKFSVLIPVYAKENPIYFKESLKSIWDDQTLKPDEIVLVKDGPLTEELESIIYNFSLNTPLKMVELPSNQGLGIALSEGVKACSYDLIARMDSDDISRYDRFAIQLNFIKNHPEFDVIGSNILEFNKDIADVVSYRKLPENPNDLRRFAVRRNPLNHMSVIFRKEAVLKAGNYIKCIGYEDYFLWCRMMLKGSKFYNLQDNLIYARIGNGMILRRQGKIFYNEELRYQKELYRLGFLSFPVYASNFFLRAIPRLFPIWGLKIIYKFLRK